MIRCLHSPQSQFFPCASVEITALYLIINSLSPFMNLYSLFVNILFMSVSSLFVALSCGKVRDNLTHYALFEVFILFYLSGCNIPFIHIITSIRFFRIFASSETFHLYICWILKRKKNHGSRRINCWESSSWT